MPAYEEPPVLPGGSFLRSEILYFHKLVFSGAVAQFGGCLDGEDAVAAFDPLHQMGLAGIGAGIDQIDTGLIDGDEIGRAHV